MCLSFRRSASRAPGCALVFCLVILGVGSARAEGPETSAVLDVLVTGFPSDEGVAFLGLFDERGGYDDPDARPDTSARLPIREGQVHWRIESLQPGDYAVRVYHDANANERLDRARRGIPTEHFGFSNNPPRRRGPALWKDARIELGPGETHIEIELFAPATNEPTQAASSPGPVARLGLAAQPAARPAIGVTIPRSWSREPSVASQLPIRQTVADKLM